MKEEPINLEEKMGAPFIYIIIFLIIVFMRGATYGPNT